MGRIFAVISVVVFAVVLGCGEAPESIGNQGGGNGDNITNNAAGGYDIIRESDMECFDFFEDGDPAADFPAYADLSDVVKSPGIAFGEPRCLSDSGLGLYESCGGQDQYHWACIEYYDWRDQAEPLDVYTNDESCLWKVVADNDGVTCGYGLRCVPERAWRGVESHEGEFPDRWDNAVDLHCDEWMVPRVEASSVDHSESVEVGSSVSIPVEIKNVGHDTLLVWDALLPAAAVNGPFSEGDGWPGGEVEVDAGGSVIFYVDFSPDEIGDHRVTISASTNDQERETVMVRVDAVAH